MIHHTSRAALAALAALLLGMAARPLSAQCSLTINPVVNVALGAGGTHLVGWDDVLEGTPACSATLLVTVFDPDRTPRPLPQVDCADVGRRLRVNVLDVSSGANVDGFITVADLLAPTVSVVSPVALTCVDDLAAALAGTVSATDNCDASPELIVSETASAVGCGPLAQTITRTVRAIDAEGNLSPPVTQVIEVARVDLAAVTGPADLVWRSSANGGACPSTQPLPAPEAPTLGGQPITGLCKVLFTSSDDELQACGATRKVLRTFRLLDCCTGQTRDLTQLISLIDDTPPTAGAFAGPALIEAIPGAQCVSRIRFPALANLSDNCDAIGAGVSVQIATNGFGALPANGGLLATPIPVGTTVVATYTITDACGNVATRELTVDVVDNEAPVIQCNPTAVGINGIADVEVFAATLGANTRDNCCLDSLLVRRAGPGAFGPSVTLTCADAGTTVFVELRAVDCNGLANTLTCSVEAQDKLTRAATPPPAATTLCALRPAPTAGVNGTGEPTISDACGAGSFTFVDEPVDANCPDAAVTRVFTVTFANGSTTTVTQRIDYLDVAPTLPALTFACRQRDSVLAGLAYPDLGATCRDYVALPRERRVVDATDPCDQEYEVIFPFQSTCPSFATLRVRQSVRFVDDEAPEFDDAAGSLDLFFGCAADVPDPLPRPVPTATDACGPTAAVVGAGARASVFTDLSTTGCPSFVQEYRYLAADGCGNVSADTFLVTVTLRDTVAPTSAFADLDVAVACLDDLTPAAATADAVLAASADDCGGTAGAQLSVAIDTSDQVRAGLNACADRFERVFTVSDACGNALRVVQAVRVRNDEPIVFAAIAPDTTVYGCPADIPAADTTLLSLVSGACGGFRVVDTFETAPPPCAGTVTRVYTAADACGNTGTAVQTFRFADSTPPLLTVPADRDEVTAFNECSVTLVLTASATADECTGAAPTVTNSFTGTGATAAGAFPAGRTEVVFEATDECMNATRDTTVVIVRDLSPPGPSCFPQTVFIRPDGVAVVDPQAIIDANEFRDDCTPREALEISFSADALRFGCDSVNMRFGYELTVTDGVDTGTCSGFFTIRDTSTTTPTYCGNAPRARFALGGRVAADPALLAAGLARMTARTDEGDYHARIAPNGEYAFDGLPAGAVALEPVVGEEAPAGGVTTYDLVVAGRHILGAQPITTTEALLAADVDCSGHVSAIDLTRIRRVILGLDAAFPEGRSTISYPSGHAFADPLRPWAEFARLSLGTDDLRADVRDYDVTTLKLGDLNGSARLRPRGTTYLVATDRLVREGEEVRLTLTASRDLAGLQLALATAGGAAVVARGADENFDVHTALDGPATRVSVAQDVRAGEPLLEVAFVAERAGRLSELLAVERSGAFPAESYLGSDLALNGLGLRFEPGEGVLASGAGATLTASPNPFADELTVEVGGVGEGAYTLLVTDLVGRRFAERRIGEVTGGERRVRFDASAWPEGVYAVRVLGAGTERTVRVLLQR